MKSKKEVYSILKEKNYLPFVDEKGRYLLTEISNLDDLEIKTLTRHVNENKDLEDFILKKVNNLYRIGSSNFTDVKDAMVYIGLNATRNLVVFYLTTRFAGIDHFLDNKFNLKRYWRHVLSTAYLSEEMGKLITGTNMFSKFSYGLLHDIGVLSIFACLPKEKEEIQSLIDIGYTLQEAEEEVLDGITHQEIGGLLFSEWGFCDDMVNVAKYHHNPFDAKVFNKRVAIISLGNNFGYDYIDGYRKINPEDETNLRLMNYLELEEKQLDKIYYGIENKLDELEEKFTLFEY